MDRPQSQSKPLATIWTSGLDGEKKISFEQAVRNSTVALGRLHVILDQKEQALLSLITKDERFAEAAWAEHTAGLLGQLKEIRAMKALVAFAQ